MSQVPYTKPPLSINDQLDLLTSRGLRIDNQTQARHLLRSIGYYRLSGYWYPLLSEPKSAHTFKPEASFEKAFIMYCFDYKLRSLLLDQLSKIEVHTKAKLGNTYSMHHGPFWVENVDLFRRRDRHDRIIETIKTEYDRSNAEFARSFRSNYSNPLPPSWMILEFSSFGVVSRIISNLVSSIQLKSLSRGMGLNEEYFKSWMHALVYLRNLCAHHSRCWNNEMQVVPKIPRLINTRTGRPYPFPSNPWINTSSLSNRRCYYFICVIKYFLDIVHTSNLLKDQLTELFDSYPSIDIEKSLDFPNDWEGQPLWQ